MGVLACGRNGCENIMCDRYSHTYGYICNSCYEELVDLPNIDIGEFLSSEKDSSIRRNDWVNYCEDEFSIIGE